MRRLELVVGAHSIDESVAFYTEGLGIFAVSVVFLHGEDGPSEVLLGLVEGSGSGLLIKRNATIGPIEFVVTIEDWEVVEERLKDRSIEYGPVHELPYGIQANLDDPFGNHIVLFQEFA